MSNKRNKHTRKITKSGKYTYYVVIPKEMLRSLGWRERQKVTVEKYGKGIWIKDWSRTK